MNRNINGNGNKRRSGTELSIGWTQLAVTAQGTSTAVGEDDSGLEGLTAHFFRPRDFLHALPQANQPRGEEPSPPSLFQTGAIFLSLQLAFYLFNKLRLWGSQAAANEKYTPLETNLNTFKNPFLSMTNKRL